MSQIKKLIVTFPGKYSSFNEFHYASLLIDKYKQKCNVDNKKNIFLNFYQ